MMSADGSDLKGRHGMRGRAPPSPNKRSRLARSILAAVLPPFAAFVVQSIFWSTLSPRIWLLFYPAVFLSSWLGGLRSGVAATLLSTALVWWSFIPPERTLVKEDPKNFIVAGVFGAMGLAFSVFHERLKRANRANDVLRQAQQAEAKYRGIVAIAADAI